jgi:hypothetical protein
MYINYITYSPHSVRNMFCCYEHKFVWLRIDIKFTNLCKHDYRQLGSKEADSFMISELLLTVQEGRFSINLIGLFVCVFVSFPGVTTHCGFIFHSPAAGRGFLITHNDAPQSVGLLWTSDQSVAEIST